MSQFPPLRDIEEMLSGFGRALHPRELASRLNLSSEQYSELISALDELQQDGGIQVLPGGRVRTVARRGKPNQKRDEARDETWDGEISVHAKGFAFVTSPGHDDVFVPPDAVYEAFHRDLVRVRVTGRSHKGLEGVVTEVIERRNTRIAGVVQRKRKSAWLEPDDSRVRGPILLTGDLGDAKDGDAAVADITQFPHFADELAEGKIVEVLGPAGDPQTEVKKILLREGVSEVHSAEALQNAEQMAHRLRAIRLGTRRDLRDVPLPTIDPEDARDHDDALWVERTGNGYRAYIAIADVSEFVRPESPLDEEARARGCTIYLPDRAIPMLPRALAGDLCSLLPDQDRFCLCVIADIDNRANTSSFEIVEGVMRSQAKLTYGSVARALGLDPESPQSPQAEAMKDSLAVLQELAEKLRKNRMTRGALDLDLPESRVVLDEESGAPTEVKKRATRPGLKKAYSLVEEMMLLANELVAEWLTKKSAPAIYRVHGKPDPQKLERLATITQDLNLDVEMDDLTEPLGAAKFLARIQTHERKHVLEMLLLRSLKQAIYDTTNVGHFGLASERYVHFTSPIRRYPDLRVHRQIKHILRGGKIDKSDEAKDDLTAAASESSKRERAAMEVEREVKNLYCAIYMKRHIGEEFEGRITGISGAGIYLSIDDPCVDVMIAFDELGPEEYETDEQEIGVVGKRSGERLMMGDLIQILIIDVGIIRRTVYGRRVWNEDDYDFKKEVRISTPARRGGKTFRGEVSARRGPGERAAPDGQGGRRTFKGRGKDGSRREEHDEPGARAKPARGATGTAAARGRSFRAAAKAAPSSPDGRTDKPGTRTTSGAKPRAAESKSASRSGSMKSGSAKLSSAKSGSAKGSSKAGGFKTSTRKKPTRRR